MSGSNHVSNTQERVRGTENPAVPASVAPPLRVSDLSVEFESRRVLERLDLTVPAGEILGVVGASGSGKSVLMRSILGLAPRVGGLVEVFGRQVGGTRAQPQSAARDIERRCGVLFQHGALFSSLSVRQNVQVPMRAHARFSRALMDELALLKLEMAGFPRHSADKMPNELSGGMVKRAALARALALDPELLFLDEPTAGLDSAAAAAFDELILDLRDALNLTVFMITHDLDSMTSVCDSIAIVGEGRIVFRGTIGAISLFNHPWAISYFGSARARARFGGGDVPGDGGATG